MNKNTIILLVLLFLYFAYKKWRNIQMLKLLPELLSSGAKIIDVRSLAEYNSGHREGSINIPLSEIEAELSKLNKTQTIILCCASGSRSAMAKNKFTKNGFTSVYNMGSWRNL